MLVKGHGTNKEINEHREAILKALTDQVDGLVKGKMLTKKVADDLKAGMQDGVNNAIWRSFTQDDTDKVSPVIVSSVQVICDFLSSIGISKSRSDEPAGCHRCGGDMLKRKDEYGAYMQCQQCGNQVVSKWVRNLEEGLVIQTIEDMRKYTQQIQKVISNWKGGDRK